MKLLTLYKGTQFATKSCIRQQKAFRADIFIEFDLDNDLFTLMFDNIFSFNSNYILVNCKVARNFIRSAYIFSVPV